MDENGGVSELRKEKLFIYEFLSGEGKADEGLHADVAVEGLAMLLGVTEDFSAAGFNTTTTINSRIEHLSGKFESRGVSVRRVSFQEGVDEADYCLVIAPESGGTLYSLVKDVERKGKVHLGPGSIGVALTTDKMKTLRLAEDVGLKAPFTLEAEGVEDALRKVEEVGFPAVFKPIDGVGCEGVSVVWDERNAEVAAELAVKTSGTGKVIVQEYVEGVDASVGVIVGEGEASPLTLNAQLISRGDRGVLRYEGGYVPLNHRRRKEALRTAEMLASSIPGLKGYVGVDLVLTSREAFVMEVNPRITTSYLGVRKVMQGNIAKHIFDACTKGVTPGKVKVKGGAAFRKTSVTLESADWMVSINKEHFIVCCGRNAKEALAKAGIQL